MIVQRLKATLPGHKGFFRVYEVKPDMKLYSFQKFLMNDLSFAPDQICLFKGVDQDGVVVSEYGLFDMGDGSMDTISFETLIRRGERRLLWFFDLFGKRYLQFDFEDESEYVSRYSYPRLISERGINPNQFSKEYEDFEDISISIGAEVEKEE